MGTETADSANAWLLAQRQKAMMPTWVLGSLGSVLALAGWRRLAGIVWLALGAGSVGAAVTRASNGSTIFPAWLVCWEREKRFLLRHLPFLAGGVYLLLDEGGKR